MENENTTAVETGCVGDDVPIVPRDETDAPKTQQHTDNPTPDEISDAGFFDAPKQETDAGACSDSSETAAAPSVASCLRSSSPTGGQREDASFARTELGWQELADAHPELIGKDFPRAVYEEILSTGEAPLRVYERALLRSREEEIAALRQEIATLKQNAENTLRAPVTGTSGTPPEKPVDPFIAGLDRFF